MGELRYLFNRAARRDDIKKAPQVPRVEVPKKRIKWMTTEQQERVLAKMPREHRPIFFFLMDYGCRVSEACALCWDCVDMEQGVFTVARTFSRRELTDNTKGRRDNPLPVDGWFAEYLAGRPVGIGQTPVFKNPEAHPSKNPAGFYLPEFLNRVWREAVDTAGLESIPLKNATRHSVGMQRRREGWDMDLIARLLGHATPEHTRRSYVDDDVELLRERRRENLRQLRPRQHHDNQD